MLFLFARVFFLKMPGKEEDSQLRNTNNSISFLVQVWVSLHSNVALKSHLHQQNKEISRPWVFNYYSKFIDINIYFPNLMLPAINISFLEHLPIKFVVVFCLTIVGHKFLYILLRRDYTDL